MGKKNLEQLFRDTFRDFAEVPPDRVWQALEASLDKKKKRRAVPLWWQLGGAAAALALLLYVLAPMGAQPEGGPQQIITDVQGRENPDQGEQDSKPVDFKDPKGQGDSGRVADSESPGEQDATRTEPGDRHTAPKGEAWAVDQGKSTPDSRNANLQTKREGDALAVLEKRSATDSLERNMSQREPTLWNPDAPVKEALAQQENRAADRDSEGLVQKRAKAEGDALALEEQKGEADKKSLFDAIEEQKTLEEEQLAAREGGRWSMGPSVAPVYFDASGQGSPINSEFTSNSKSGNFNLSYGLSVAYELGNKLKIRTGIHRVNYGYDTNDISFSSSMRASASQDLSTIDYREESQNIVVHSNTLANSPNFLDSPSQLSSKEVSLNEMPFLDGKMVQRLGYIEVPLEVNYAVVDHTFGVDLIGGFSSLFLVDNAVLLESQEMVTEMGEANNVNSMNFSANVGMGLNYKFSPGLQFNLEPMFKYQLNTFSATAGSFRPFSVGLYSGISFKF